MIDYGIFWHFFVWLTLDVFVVNLLELFQVLIADNFGSLKLFQALILDNYGILRTFSGIN